MLWTKNNTDDYQELKINDPASVNSSYFDPALDTKVLVHGYTRCGLDPWIQELRDAFFSVEDVNIISVDWQMLAGPGPFYPAAANNTFKTGAHAADFIKFLADETAASTNTFHPIGFSLGGHVVGSIGHHLKKKYRIILPR